MLIIFVGLDRAGKSSIKIYLETLDVEKAKNTKMSNGLEVYRVGDFKIEVFPGQLTLRKNEKLYEVFFPHTSKIVFVVDAADRKRFKAVSEYWRFVKKMIEKYCNDKPQIILLAHKQDLDGAISPDELQKIIFSDEEIREFNVVSIGTSIYDPFSMASLLNILHGAKKASEDIAEALRRIANAELAFIYDGHILPVIYSSKGRDSDKIITHINDILLSLEKIDRIQAFAGYFSQKNIAVISIETNDGRVLVGVFGFKNKLSYVLERCRDAGQKYISKYRSQLWS